MPRNTQTSGKTFGTIPKRKVVEIVTDSGEHDAFILIASRGVISKDFNNPPNQRVESIIVQVNPEVAATSIFNHAVKFNEADLMLKFCKMLRDIADCAEHNIRLELQNQKTNN